MFRPLSASVSVSSGRIVMGETAVARRADEAEDEVSVSSGRIVMGETPLHSGRRPASSAPFRGVSAPPHRGPISQIGFCPQKPSICERRSTQPLYHIPPPMANLRHPRCPYTTSLQKRRNSQTTHLARWRVGGGIHSRKSMAFIAASASSSAVRRRAVMRTSRAWRRGRR